MPKQSYVCNKVNRLKVIQPKQSSGTFINLGLYPFCKQRHFTILHDLILDGAAPKEVIRLYTYHKGKRTIDRKKHWPIYIVKTGHKNYPIESITEQLFSDMGKCLKLNIAETFLGLFSNQLKLASKYFLKRHEKLVKGAEIYGEFLDGDTDFINEIEQENFSQELITIDFTYQSLKHKYKNGQHIFNDYIKLLLFDALVGNNDRHSYNWGVVETQKKYKQKMYEFSPIYDTARGMFWNITESKLRQYLQAQKLKKYIRSCKAKTSYRGDKKENHFKLIENIWQNKQKLGLETSLFKELINHDNLSFVNKMLDDKYKSILSNLRFQLIKTCLGERFNIILKIIDS